MCFLMLSVPTALVGSYNPRLVALSVVIAVFASYAALDLAGRVTAARGRVRLIWLMGGASAMGLGIWSMHYVGMLAFSLPIPVLYNWPTVVLSLLVAMLASAVALYVVSRETMGAWRAVVGSILKLFDDVNRCERGIPVPPVRTCFLYFGFLHIVKFWSVLGVQRIH